MIHTVPTSFKLTPEIKARIIAFNKEHQERPIKLQIFINAMLDKYLIENGF